MKFMIICVQKRICNNKYLLSIRSNLPRVHKNSLTGVYALSFTENGECSICHEQKDGESDECKILVIIFKRGQIGMQPRFLH